MVWTPLWREKGRLRPTALVPDTARPVPPPGLCLGCPCRLGRLPHRLRSGPISPALWRHLLAGLLAATACTPAWGVDVSVPLPGLESHREDSGFPCEGGGRLGKFRAGKGREWFVGTGEMLPAGPPHQRNASSRPQMLNHLFNRQKNTLSPPCLWHLTLPGAQ